MYLSYTATTDIRVRVHKFGLFKSSIFYHYSCFGSLGIKLKKLKNTNPFKTNTHFKHTTDTGNPKEVKIGSRMLMRLGLIEI